MSRSKASNFFLYLAGQDWWQPGHRHSCGQHSLPSVSFWRGRFVGGKAASWPQSHGAGWDAFSQTTSKSRSTIHFCRRSEQPLALSPSEQTRRGTRCLAPSSEQTSLSWTGLTMSKCLSIWLNNKVFHGFQAIYVFKAGARAGFKSKWGHVSVGVCMHELGA